MRYLGISMRYFTDNCLCNWSVAIFGGKFKGDVEKTYKNLFFSSSHFCTKFFEV
jgi:hypothetical protein